MKEFLEFAKGEFMEAKWYDKIWTIFLALCYIIELVMMVYFILFESSMIIRALFLFLWSAIMLAVGMLIGVTID